MVSSVLTAALLMASVANARCQERTMNTNAPGGLRQWPLSGNWVVELVRSDDDKLACITVTGLRNEQRGDFYIWGSGVPARAGPSSSPTGTPML